jgi:hypothetical protein
LRLLLDEDTQASRLVAQLREGGRDVLTVAQAGCAGAGDPQVLMLATEGGRALLTRNCADYLLLHQRGTAHAGILCVYQGPDPGKAMRYADIVLALGNVERSAVPLSGTFVALNAWVY